MNSVIKLPTNQTPPGPPTPKERGFRKRNRRSADGAVYTQPSTRSYITWSPALIRSTEQTADSGNLSAAADCFDWILSDERARTVLETRVGGLLGAPISFEGGARRARVAKRVLRAIEAQEDWWAMNPTPEVMQLMVWGMGLGVGLAQKVWTERNGRLIPVLEWWHSRNLRQDVQGQWWVKVADETGLSWTEVPIAENDRNWFLYMPWGKTQPWRRGFWRGMSLWRLLADYAMSDYGRLGEIAARIFISPSEKVTKEARAQLAREIRAAGRDQITVLPPGFTASKIELSATIEGIYKSQIDLKNQAYAIGVLGQNLTTEVKGGSFAASVTSEGVEIRRLKYDDEVSSNEWHDGPLSEWAEVNFGDAQAAPWPSRKVEPPKDFVRWASAIAAAVPQLIELDTGIPGALDWAAILKDLDIPVLPDVDIKELIATAAKLAEKAAADAALAEKKAAAAKAKEAAAPQSPPGAEQPPGAPLPGEPAPEEQPQP